MTLTALFTEALPDDLPDAAGLIESIRARLAAHEDAAAIRAGLLADHPALALLAPVPVLAEWLGIRQQSIYVARTRTRSDGQPVWTEPEETILGRHMWTFAGVAMHRAHAPGRGWNLRAETRSGAR